ncbi:hypothetical protein VTO73DRAFT_5602 [Trametes versicolor]
MCYARLPAARPHPPSQVVCAAVLGHGIQETPLAQLRWRWPPRTLAHSGRSTFEEVRFLRQRRGLRARPVLGTSSDCSRCPNLRRNHTFPAFQLPPPAAGPSQDPDLTKALGQGQGGASWTFDRSCSSIQQQTSGFVGLGLGLGPWALNVG